MSRIEHIGDATLYLGDCREILPTIGNVDAVITDPPYGIGWEYLGYKDSFSAWCALMDTIIPSSRKIASRVALAVGPIEAEKHIMTSHDPTWRVCWYRGSTGARCSIGFRDWETNYIWGSPPKPMHDHFHAVPELRDLGHSCPKPVEWGEWFVHRLSVSRGIVVDPFLGSGTTGIAALKLGRKFIGMEIEPKYFDIACRRIEDANRRPDMFVELDRRALEIQFSLPITNDRETMNPSGRAIPPNGEVLRGPFGLGEAG